MNSGMSAGDSGMPWARSRMADFGPLIAYSSWDRSSGIYWAQFSNKIHQRANIFHRRFRQDSVTQVKDVPGTAAGLVENGCGARAQLFLPGKEQYWIKIALHRPLKLQAAPSLV